MLCVDHQQEGNIELGCWPFREAQDSEASWQERAEAHVPTDTCSADQIAKPAVWCHDLSMACVMWTETIY